MRCRPLRTRFRLRTKPRLCPLKRSVALTLIFPASSKASRHMSLARRKGLTVPMHSKASMTVLFSRVVVPDKVIDSRRELKDIAFTPEGFEVRQS